MIVLITAIIITCNATWATTNSDDKDNNYNSIKRLLTVLLIVILVTSQTIRLKMAVKIIKVTNLSGISLALATSHSHRLRNHHHYRSLSLGVGSNGSISDDYCEFRNLHRPICISSIFPRGACVQLNL